MDFSVGQAMAILPDNFATMIEEDQRRVLLRGMVMRQQLSRLAMKGLNATRAAAVVGCGKDTARAIYRDPAFRKEVISRVDEAFGDIDAAFVESRKTLHERLAEKAEKAYDVLCGMLDDEATLPTLRFKVATDFLDRNPETQAGHTVTKLDVALQSDSLRQAAAIAREMDGRVGEKVLPMKKRA